jgi:excisionase family DNA binding protein
METMRRPPPSGTRALLTSVALDDLATSRAGEPMGKDELTPTEVAREFNVSPATVRRWEKSGVLPPTRRLPGSGHRRYSRADVEALKAKLNDQSTPNQQR